MSFNCAACGAADVAGIYCDDCNLIPLELRHGDRRERVLRAVRTPYNTVGLDDQPDGAVFASFAADAAEDARLDALERGRADRAVLKAFAVSPKVDQKPTARRTRRSCGGCSRSFMAVRSDALYCSSKCRQRATRRAAFG
jgi:hypothetical protein